MLKAVLFFFLIFTPLVSSAQDCDAIIAGHGDYSQAIVELAQGTIRLEELKVSGEKNLYVKTLQRQLDKKRTELGAIIDQAELTNLLEVEINKQVSANLIAQKQNKLRRKNNMVDERSLRPWREKVKLPEHPEKVYTVLFSPDGQYVVTISDGEARIWNAHTGVNMRMFDKEKRVQSVIFSPDSRFVAVGGIENGAGLYEISTSKELFRFGSEINKMIYSKAGDFIVTGGRNNMAQIWHASTGQELQAMEHDHPIYSIELSPDNRSIVTTAGTTDAKVWDVKTGKLRFALVGHTKDVLSATFSPDNQYIATGSHDQTARVWDAQTGHEVYKIDDVSFLNMVFAKFSLDGRYVITTEGPQARLWNVKTGAYVRELSAFSDYHVRVVLSPDGRSVATFDVNGAHQIWDMETGLPVEQLQTEGVSSMAFSADGRGLVTGSYDKTVTIWTRELTD